MTRVLLNGSSQLTDEIQGYLDRWGMQVCRLPGVPLDFSFTLLRRCDVVIVCGEECDELCPEGEIVPPDTPPILFVGQPSRRGDDPLLGFNTIAGPGQDGCLLEEALATCLAYSQQVRRERAERHGFHQYAQFLNHELRTPITAVGTALQILVEELAQRGEERLLGFANIGLRNVQRLQRTMAWSEGYLASRSLELIPDWQEWSVEMLVARATAEACAADELTVELATTAATQPLLSDAQLFGTVVQQVLHAVRYYAPDQAVTLQVKVSTSAEIGPLVPGGDDGPMLLLAYFLQPCAGEGLEPGQVARTGLVQRGDRPDEELLRLIEFTVSQEILALFGASLSTFSAPCDGEPVVTVVLPLEHGLAHARSERAICEAVPQ